MKETSQFPTDLEQANGLRKRIAELTVELKDAEAGLNRLTTRCNHQWTEPVYIPEHHEGYQDHGDPPGTMGVDRRLPSYIPARTIDEWKRTCTQCGHTQKTRHTRKEQKPIIVSGRQQSVEVDVPAFY